MNSCKTCKNRKNRECDVLNDLLLVMVRTNKEQRVLDKKMLIKDKTLDTLSCNHYQVKG